MASGGFRFTLTCEDFEVWNVECGLLEIGRIVFSCLIPI